MRKLVVLTAALVVALLVVAASAHAVQLFLVPAQVVGFSALQMPDGSIATRYTVTHVIDRYAPNETCIAVILDTVSGAFSATAVPAASCLTRRTQ